MEWNAIYELIDTQFAIVVAACWVIGYVLKLTPKVPDWFIVYAVAAVGVVAIGFMQGFTVPNAIQGILCGAVAVYGHQVVKQAKKAADSYE